MTETPTAAPGALVPVPDPVRARVEALRAALAARRDRVAEVDLEIETRKRELADLECWLGLSLAREHDELARLDEVVRQLERWHELLAEGAVGLVDRARRLDQRRQREVRRRRRRRPAPPPEPAAPPADESERLKHAFRALARRYHPDLASGEAERVRFGEIMARINALYHGGEVERLETMAAGAEVEALDLAAGEPAEQVHALQAKLTWLDTVVAGLAEERTALEQSPTAELARRLAESRARGGDLVAEIRAELDDRLALGFADVAAAARALEVHVQKNNRRRAALVQPTRGPRRVALEATFDPYADKRLVRLSLSAAAAARLAPAVRERAHWLARQAEENAPLLRLVLLTHVSALSPFPLGSLDRYDELERRFGALGADDDAPVPLGRALVAADALVEFGVRRATEKVVHTGLRFRDGELGTAVAAALASAGVRRELRRVLAVLGERRRCPGCSDEVFSVPLYRTRGLDNLRANVCPRCAHVLDRYRMPRGDDVQAVLNPSYLDLELVVELSLRLARVSVGMQLLPLELDSLTVGALKQRLFADLLGRYQLGLKRQQIRLLEARVPISDRTPLADLASHSLTIRFTDDSSLGELEALELLRHRIRNQFQREE